VTLRGTVIVVANEGQRIDIPDGCILENRLLSGNLTMTVRAHCCMMRSNSPTPFSFRICDWIVLYRGPYLFFHCYPGFLDVNIPQDQTTLYVFLGLRLYTHTHTEKNPHLFIFVYSVSLSFCFFFFFFVSGLMEGLNGYLDGSSHPSFDRCRVL